MTDKKDDSKDIFRAALGLNNNAGTYAGGAVGLAGLIGSFIANQNEKTYTQATRGAQAQYEAVGASFTADADQMGKTLTADLAGYQSAQEANIKQGLVNRGITDKAIGESATSQFKAGMSGAYASAHAALQGARVNAQSALDRTKVAYLTDLTQKQHASVMQKYYNQMGLWGALGSVGGSLMGMPSTPSIPKPTIQDSPGMPGTDERGGK